MFAGIFKGIEEPIKQPLIAHGEKEINFNIRQAKEWHETNPESMYAIVQDAGHIANQDNPEEFNRMINLFLRQIKQ